MGGAGSHLVTFHRRGSDFVLRVDYARWGQTPDDLRHLALSAPHARTRERALALFDITQHRCATQVAVRTGRRAHTVMSWVHAYNAQGPDALTFRRTGGRRPLFCPHRRAELGKVINAAQRTAATPPIVGADPAPRWTLRRLVHWARERFGLRCCRETIRTALHGLTLSWKKAKKLLGRADPERRQAFLERVQDLLAGAQRDQHLVVFLDEAHIIRIAISAMGGSSGASVYGSPPARQACPRVSRSTGCISTTKARYGSGPTRAPTANTPSTCCAGSAPKLLIAS